MHYLAVVVVACEEIVAALANACLLDREQRGARIEQPHLPCFRTASAVEIPRQGHPL